MTQPSPVTGKEDIVDKLRFLEAFNRDHAAQCFDEETRLNFLALSQTAKAAADEIERLRRSSGGERGDVIEECARAAENTRFPENAEIGEIDGIIRDMAFEDMKLKIIAAIRSLREAGGGDE